MDAVTPQRKPNGALLFCLGLASGAAGGFGAGVLSVGSARQFLSGLFHDERRADGAHPQTFGRPAFELRYPGNWRIETTDPDFDPDHLFSIGSPGQSFVMFIIADGELEPRASLDAQVTAQTTKVMHDAVRKEFKRWGSFVGEGMLLTGKHLGLAAGTIRIFAFREGPRTYTMIESTYDDDRSMVQPGFQLVERTFQVKGAT